MPLSWPREAVGREISGGHVHKENRPDAHPSLNGLFQHGKKTSPLRKCRPLPSTLLIGHDLFTHALIWKRFRNFPLSFCGVGCLNSLFPDLSGWSMPDQGTIASNFSVYYSILLRRNQKPRHRMIPCNSEIIYLNINILPSRNYVRLALIFLTRKSSAKENKMPAPTPMARIKTG